ncbi:BgTH12-05217, partial [Blumeria graminis f. sp. triticale]
RDRRRLYNLFFHRNPSNISQPEKLQARLIGKAPYFLAKQNPHPTKMKILNLEWLVALFCISKLAIANTIFHCGSIPITAEDIKTAYNNSKSAPIAGYPTIMRIQYFEDAFNYTAYPMLLNGATSLTNPNGHYFLVWTENFSNWNVIMKLNTETKFCQMTSQYWGSSLQTILNL